MLYEVITIDDAVHVLEARGLHPGLVGAGGDGVYALTDFFERAENKRLQYPGVYEQGGKKGHEHHDYHEGEEEVARPDYFLIAEIQFDRSDLGTAVGDGSYNFV